jgi:uncharacterized membrane protein
MHKERLELFSDGVFAIILTLLVLDLKVPHAEELAGLREAAPGLLIHALTFFVVGMSWLAHHGTLSHAREVTSRTLLLNLLYLLFVTLLPFGARIAAEDHWSSLGAFLLASCSAIGTITLIGLQRTTASDLVTVPHMVAWRVRRRRLFYAIAALGLACAGLSFASPRFGYAFLSSYALGLFLPSPIEAERKMRDRLRADELARA